MPKKPAAPTLTSLNPYDVAPGQAWISTDPRFDGPPIFYVESVHTDDAVAKQRGPCAFVYTLYETPQGQKKRHRYILLARFKRGSTGYARAEGL